MTDGLKKLLLVFLGLLLAVLTGEAAVRLIAPRVLIRPLGIVLDPDLIYHLPSNAHGLYGKQGGEWYIEVRTNSRGLRDREIPYERTPGTFRILGMGDSTTYAEGVEIEETYLKRLEDSLQQKFPVEVINAAVRGWGPDQQVAFFDKEGYRYRPDATVIAFFSGNDFEDVLHGRLFRLENGRAVHQQATVETSPKFRYYSHQNRIQSLPLYGWLMSRSHLANLLRQAYPRLAIRRIYRRNKDNEVNFTTLNEGEEKKAWGLVRGIYEHLLSEGGKTGRLFVLLLPNYDEVQAGKSSRSELMAEFCRERSIAHLEMLPVLREHLSRGERIYYKDGYLTPEGHALVARELEKALFSSGVLAGLGGRPNG